MSGAHGSRGGERTVIALIKELQAGKKGTALTGGDRRRVVEHLLPGATRSAG